MGQTLVSSLGKIEKEMEANNTPGYVWFSVVNPIEIISKCNPSSQHIAPTKGSEQPFADGGAVLPTGW